MDRRSISRPPSQEDMKLSHQPKVRNMNDLMKSYKHIVLMMQGTVGKGAPLGKKRPTSLAGHRKAPQVRVRLPHVPGSAPREEPKAMPGMGRSRSEGAILGAVAPRRAGGRE